MLVAFIGSLSRPSRDAALKAILSPSPLRVEVLRIRLPASVKSVGAVRVAFLSDFHLRFDGSDHSEHFAAELNRALRLYAPHLLLLGGDYVDGRVQITLNATEVTARTDAKLPAFFRPLVRAAAERRPTQSGSFLGAFGSFGNHEGYFPEAYRGRLSRMLRRADVRLILNDFVLLPSPHAQVSDDDLPISDPESERGAAMALVSVDDATRGKADWTVFDRLHHTLLATRNQTHTDFSASSPKPLPVLLLSHHPDAMEALLSQPSPFSSPLFILCVVLSGHTHGGQINIPPLADRAHRSGFTALLYYLTAFYRMLPKWIGRWLPFYDKLDNVKHWERAQGIHVFAANVPLHLQQAQQQQRQHQAAQKLVLYVNRGLADHGRRANCDPELSILDLVDANDPRPAAND
jgi:predicted MPP superfamily phosphohydrolase